MQNKIAKCGDPAIFTDHSITEPIFTVRQEYNNYNNGDKGITDPTGFKEVREYLKKVQVIAEKRAALASETATDDLWNSLQAANSCIKELENLLAEKDTECHRLQSELDRATKKLHVHQDDSAVWKGKHEKTYHELRMQCQTTKRGQQKLTKLQDQVQILKIAEKEACSQYYRSIGKLW